MVNSLPVNEYGFVTEFTFPYPLTYSQFSKLRNRIPLASYCEIPRCDYTYQFVYDHCHLHDFIRGSVCLRHNTDILRSDMPVNTKWHKAWIMRCPKCVSLINTRKPNTPTEWRNMVMGK